VVIGFGSVVPENDGGGVVTEISALVVLKKWVIH